MRYALPQSVYEASKIAIPVQETESQEKLINSFYERYESRPHSQNEKLLHRVATSTASQAVDQRTEVTRRAIKASVSTTRNAQT